MLASLRLHLCPVLLTSSQLTVLTWPCVYGLSSWPNNELCEGRNLVCFSSLFSNMLSGWISQSQACVLCTCHNLYIPCVLACEVHFENTRVPVENVLGEVGGGFKVSCRPASCESHAIPYPFSYWASLCFTFGLVRLLGIRNQQHGGWRNGLLEEGVWVG